MQVLGLDGRRSARFAISMEAVAITEVVAMVRVRVMLGIPVFIAKPT